MWQNLRLKTEEQNQFLGDMFEFFLDNSIKQSEGQFFTPLPICKFIVTALPLEDKIQEVSEPLKVIDYACGAGHFLTEYAQQIKPLIKKHKEIDTSRYYETIFGIEKEDRLAKISKVSAYMYGQDQIRILDQDALSDIPEIQENSFDILIANPPFAVEGFFKTLSEKQQETYELHHISGLNSNTNNIQCFFIERAKQILAPNGLIGIIVPSSVLSNSDAMHIATREIILKFFDVISIVELGSGTFGKTGTNTVVLFLRRKARKPEPAEHYKNRVLDFFDGISDRDAELPEYRDLYLIRDYCQHTELPYESYRKFLNLNLTGWQTLEELTDLLETDIFKDYQADFEKSTELKNLKRKSIFKKKTAEEKKEILTKKLIDYLFDIEQDKLFYFIMSQDQSPQVLIVKSPSDNKKQKQFLGYEWSGAKGSEGIKYYGGETVHDIITPLFDPQNRDNAEKISFAIRQNFTDEPLQIDTHTTQNIEGNDVDTHVTQNVNTHGGAYLREYCAYASLTDMLDFSRKDFSKAFSLTPKKKIQIKTKWESDKLGNIAEVKKGKAITKKDTKEGKVKVVAGGLDFAYYHNETNRPKNTITVSASGANAGFVNFWREPIFASDCSTVLGNSDELTIYLFNVLKYLQNDIFGLARGSAQPHVYPDDISNITIPLPPLKVQNQIVSECEAIDKETQKAEETIQKLKAKIEEKVGNIEGKMVKLNEITSKIGSGATPRGGENSYKESGISLIRSQNIYDDGFKTKGLAFIDEEQAQKLDNVTVEKDDVLFNITGASVARCCVVDAKYLPARVNQHVAIIRPNEQVLSKYLQSILISPKIKKQLLDIAGSSATREAITKIQLEEFKIPLLPLSSQEKLVSELEKIESEIGKNQEIISNAQARKQAVMEKYL